MSMSDQEIYPLLRAAEVVGNQYAFSGLCGHSAGWHSSNVCRNRQASVNTLAVLVDQLHRLAAEEVGVVARRRIELVADVINAERLLRAGVAAANIRLAAS